MSKINKEYLRLKKVIEDSYKQIDDLQSICKHEDVEKKYNNDSDDYDAPGKGISYWHDCKCNICGKRYRQDISHRLYNG
jgi:hypothetical protein